MILSVAGTEQHDVSAENKSIFQRPVRLDAGPSRTRVTTMDDDYIWDHCIHGEHLECWCQECADDQDELEYVEDTGS